MSLHVEIEILRPSRSTPWRSHAYYAVLFSVDDMSPDVKARLRICGHRHRSHTAAELCGKKMLQEKP